MCGIVGYVGERNCTPILLDGLRRLEYRGYDSAGVAVLTGEENSPIQVVRAQGKLAALEELLSSKPLAGPTGIGHTRWATHGKPSEANAHPHVVGNVAVVHNGIIENYLDLREKLIAAGHSFSSETDSEIFAHLIDENLRAGVPLEEAVKKALLNVQGAYALAVVSLSEPGKIVCARNASPLVIGLGDGENYIASDVPAILNLTRKVLFLDEGEIAVITKDGASVQTLEGEKVNRHYRQVTWSPVQAEKGGYKHYMIKEIFEQPRAIVDTCRGRVFPASGRVSLDGINIQSEQVARLKRFIIIGCGTSYYAGMTGRSFLEAMLKVPVQIELASEFRYRDPIIDQDDIVLGISQSGETADTLAALKVAKAKGAQVLSICNVVDSSIPRLSDGVLYTHAGPEIGVASTKAFTCQVACLHLLGLYLGQLAGNLSEEAGRKYIEELLEMPVKMGIVLDRLENSIREVAWRFYQHRNFLFLGRGNNFPIAMEGALKLKETSYIHGEGYAAGELKHGPIALIDEEMPVVVIAPQDQHYEKTINNLEEVKARGGRILALGTDGDERIARSSDHVIYLPPVPNHFSPLVTVLPLQLLAYHIADLKGTDVDQPRNLAKSVTVE